MIIRRWGSLLITIALLLSVGIFLKRYDFELLGQVKAFLTVMFGLATSFLILSFIWLLQRKPLHGNWTGLSASSVDSPSMNPRGRVDSIESLGHEQRRPTVCTVSSMLDRPPDYEDALINSKPINWHYLPLEKASHYPNCPLESTSAQNNITTATAAAQNCSCPEHHFPEAVQSTTSGDCCIVCMNERAQDKVISKSNPVTGNSVAQLALTIVRGFTTTLEVPSVSNNNNNQQVCATNQMSSTENIRKTSYSQLDVSQLMISGSPPKYSKLVLSGMIDENFDSNNSDNPRDTG